MIELIIGIILAFHLLAAIYAFFAVLKDWRKDVAARRYNTLRRFKADRNGNYPAFFDPASGDHFMPPSGNPYAPAPAQILMYNGAQKDIKPAGRDVPLIINYGGRRPPEQIEPVRIEVDERKPLEQIEAGKLGELAEPSPFARSEAQIRAGLGRAKTKGEGKVASIISETGCKKGNSTAYLYWSNVWDNIIKE